MFVFVLETGGDMAEQMNKHKTLRDKHFVL